MESRLSEGQIELFHALGKICEKVGREWADGKYLDFTVSIFCIVFRETWEWDSRISGLG